MSQCVQYFAWKLYGLIHTSPKIKMRIISLGEESVVSEVIYRLEE